MKKSWEIKKLGDVCQLMNGYAFQSKQYTDEGYFVIRIGNVQDGYIELNNPRYIKLKDEKLKKFILQSGDILISLTGNVGRVGAIQEEHLPAVLNQRVAKIAIKKEQKIDKEYLLHFLSSEYFISELIKAGRGAAQQNISTTDIENLQIPIPSLPEQQRIVAILDEAFAAIDKVKANAEQNLKNAKELFQSYLQGVFENGDWETKTLNEISENLDSKRVPITKNVRNEGSIPYYGASGIVDFVADYLFDEDLLCVSEDGANLLARTYPIAFSITGKTWVNNHAHVLRFKNMVSQKFVEQYLNSIKLDDFVSGMAQPKLNQTMLNKIPIPYPSVKEQESIVKKLDALSAETKKLQTIYLQKINDLEELKKSVLQKAFSGEL